MNDLLQLNRTIAEHWLGKLNPDQEEYLAHTPVCVGRLPGSADELAKALAASKRRRGDVLRVLKLNRRYLHYVRLAAKDACAGHVDMLLKLGIDLDQAAFLSRLSNDDIALLALSWQGPIVEFAGKSFRRGAMMQAVAAKHHAIGFIAARTR